MGDILLVLFTLLLVLLCGFLVLVILMQKPSANAGMGSALGGGAAESALGAQAGNVLTRATIFGVSIFFVLAFGLYLGYLGDAEAGQLGTGLKEKLTEGAGAAEEAPTPKAPELSPVPEEGAEAAPKLLDIPLGEAQPAQSEPVTTTVEEKPAEAVAPATEKQPEAKPETAETTEAKPATEAKEATVPTTEKQPADTSK